MTFEEFKQDIMYELGGGLVDVEFEVECTGFDGNASIEFAFRRARDIYKQKGNNNWRKEFLALPVTKDQTLYNLPDETLGKVNTIIKIIKPTSGFNIEDPFSVTAYNDLFGNLGTLSGQCGSPRMDYLMYELTLSTLERSRRYGAYDSQWNHDQFKNTIKFLKKPETDTVWFLECYRDLTDTEYMDVLWIKEYATAIAKGMLGLAYRKFSSLPGPTGEVSLSGDQLVSESEQEKQRLIEDINNYVDGDVTYSEITFG